MVEDVVVEDVEVADVEVEDVVVEDVPWNLESSFRWLDDGQKQFCISALLAKVMKRER